MKCREVVRTTDIAVYDDVLSPTDFRQLLRHLGGLNYNSVHAHGWRKVWRLHDGDPLTSSTSWYYPDHEGGNPDEVRYPTNTPFDPLIAWIVDRLSEVGSIVGSPGSTWKRLSFAPWIYPSGSGLSLHQDGRHYSGAFTFFAHPAWRLHWGGHLLVLDPATSSPPAHPEEPGSPFLDDRDETAHVFEPGLASAIFPKPNRIVFISPTARHLMTRVDENAGQNPRISVAGFFLRHAQ